MLSGTKSMSNLNPAEKFLQALRSESPLQIAGTINAYCALLAQQAGFKCLYLSGAGVANASFAKPDLGLTHLDDVVEDARRITSSCDLPLLVDVDTGFGHETSIQDMCQKMIKIGVSVIQIEDQVEAKRCGHRDGKQLVSSSLMQNRIEECKSAIRENEMLIMARTDAYDIEGIESTLQRCKDYQQAGCDFLFAESVKTLSDYRTFVSELDIPILANITEFGKTPLFTTKELHETGIQMILYPLSAFRAMNKAASETYHNIKQQGSQSSSLNNMQTREELYKSLDYINQEDKQRHSRPDK